MVRLGIIGGGAMGEAFAGGVISSGWLKPTDITIADIDPSRQSRLRDQLGVSVGSDNIITAANAEVVLLAVKPAVVSSVLDSIGEYLRNQLIISIAAGVSLGAMESRLEDCVGVIRAMPNTPSRIGAGAIGYSIGRAVTAQQVELAIRLFESVGICIEVPERLLDAVTGLSGSGPAYAYLMIEAMSDAGVRAGLSRPDALKLAAQTIYGAAKMVIDQNEHPAVLKDQVTSPGGTTIAGVAALEKAGFRSAVMEAVKAAAKRSAELSSN